MAGRCPNPECGLNEIEDGACVRCRSCALCGEIEPPPWHFEDEHTDEELAAERFDLKAALAELAAEARAAEDEPP